MTVQLSVKLPTNFTQQLKFMSIIISIVVIISITAGDIRGATMVYFIGTCIVLGVTGLVFVATAFDLLKDAQGLRKFERCYHLLAGVMLIIGALISFSDLGGQWYWGRQSIIVSAVLGIILNGPINLLLWWQLQDINGLDREPEVMRPIYFSLGISSTPIKFVEDIPPPKYTEAYSATLNARRGHGQEQAAAPGNANVQVHQKTQQQMPFI